MSEISYYKGKMKTEMTIEALQSEMAQYLQMDNLSFLLGAGCSSNIVDENETGIPGMAVLYKSFFEKNPSFEIAGKQMKGEYDGNLEKMLEAMGAVQIANHIQTIDEVISSSEADKLMAYDGYIWACAISRKLFEHLRFPDSYWYEDMITRFLIYPRCNKIVNTTKTKYVKYEHETNASKILWSSKNYKSLEQLYLLEHIFDCVPKFEIEKDLFIAKALLSEAGGTTEYRVNKLDSDIKKQVFIALRKIVLSNIDSDIYCKLSEDEKTVYEIFKHKRYLNWLLLKFL